jgi:hypothetical protein
MLGCRSHATSFVAVIQRHQACGMASAAVPDTALGAAILFLAPSCLASLAGARHGLLPSLKGYKSHFRTRQSLTSLALPPEGGRLAGLLTHARRIVLPRPAPAEPAPSDPTAVLPAVIPEKD